MDKRLDQLFLNAEIPTHPITEREERLISLIKTACLEEYLELEHIRYDLHYKDLESAYKKGFMDSHNKIITQS